MRFRLVALSMCIGLFTACNQDSALENPQHRQPLLEFSAEPANVAPGTSSVLRWKATGVTSCTAHRDWSGDIATTGTYLTDELRKMSDYELRCAGPGGEARAIVSVSLLPVLPPPSFPLRIEPGKRYLVDSAGRPFLLHGDTAWSLMVQLTRPDVDKYLDDRQARGFNTLLVNLIEYKFATDAPRNAYGQPPFLVTGDYSTPNERYFAHVDWVLDRAAERGFLVMLVPSYLGYEGGSEGWNAVMMANGSEKLRDYGRFLGKRYRRFSNIVWTYGGDYNPPDRSLVLAIAAGIREFDGGALGTAHTGPETAALEYWGGSDWLQINSTYTYGSVYEAALRQYVRPERMPFFLIESAYENSPNVPVRRIRAQAYQALLSGATGQIFGNHPLWHFGGPGVIQTPYTWQQALEQPGSKSMTGLFNLFAGLPWWRLVPDARNHTLVAGFGTGQDRAVASITDDRSMAIIYLPTRRPISIKLDQLAGTTITARWYDPTNGLYTVDANSPLQANRVHLFRPPARNGAGDDDWVLLLESDGQQSD